MNEVVEIKSEDYTVDYDPQTATLTCVGLLRLNGMEGYAPIIQLLDRLVDQEPPRLSLDLQKLEFLNSSGINVLSKFVIKVRQKGATQVLVIGTKDIPWQVKSLRNLQRLMPDLQLQLE